MYAALLSFPLIVSPLPCINNPERFHLSAVGVYIHSRQGVLLSHPHRDATLTLAAGTFTLICWGSSKKDLHGPPLLKTTFIYIEKLRLPVFRTPSSEISQVPLTSTDLLGFSFSTDGNWFFEWVSSVSTSMIVSEQTVRPCLKIQHEIHVIQLFSVYFTILAHKLQTWY